MIELPKLKSASRRQLALVAGSAIIFLSAFSIFISLGMPGVGWILSAVMLMIARLAAPLIGKRAVVGAIGISFVHLVSFGPLADFRIQPGVGVGFAVITVVVPFLVAFSVFLTRESGRRE